MKTVLQNWRKVLWAHLLVTFSFVAIAQAQVIKGKVTDSQTGETLPGVNIVLKGTTTGTTTDASGEFSISLTEESSVLTLSFIGYKSQEVTVTNSQSFINISMEADIQSLDEVVVVGYGTQKKEHLTGAIASTDISNYAKTPVGNALSGLQGQVAGVTVSSGTGNPANSPQINIRGIGSVNGANPLYVIDGVPANPAYLNPAEIESISVLKDASAATIYGSRGFGGVVLITTKKGKSGVPQISFDSFIGVHTPNLNNIDPVTRQQKNDIATAAFDNAGSTSYPQYVTAPGTTSSDWVDEYYKTGIEQKYDVGVRGGSNNTNYSFLGGYYAHNGTVINTGLKRYNTRVNVDFNDLINGRLKIMTGLAFSRKDIKNYGDDTGSGGGYSRTMDLYATLPHKPIYDPSTPTGYAGHVPELGLQGSGNLIGERMIRRNNTQTDYLQSNLGVELKIVKGLSYKFNLGYSIEDLYTDVFTPKYDFGPAHRSENTTTSQFRSRANYVVINNILSYETKINKHTLSLLAGQSSEMYEYKSLGASNDNMPSSTVEAIGAGIGVDDAWGNIDESRLLSYFGRVSYNYDERYFVEASFRRDGSSKFGPKNRFGNFPGVSIGWAVHRENFFNVNAITELKPRFSYAIVGNQNIGSFAYQAGIASGGSALNYPFGIGLNPTAQVGATAWALADQTIRWEENAMKNYGLDVAVFDNALSFTFDYFQAKSSGMLLADPVAPSVGVQENPIRNVGTMENKGFELSIKYAKRDGDFQYNIGVNLSRTENNVEDFRGNRWVSGYVEFSNYPTTLTETGHAIGSFYMREVAGIFQTQQEIDSYVNGSGDKLQPNAAPGDFKFVDINSDGTLDDADQRYFGNGIPKLEAGINFDASWKNFDLTLMFYGTFGNKMYNAFKHNAYKGWYSRDLVNAWTPENSGSDIPRLVNGDPNGNYNVASNYFLEDGSYLRLRNIQVGYTLPATLLQNFGVSKVRIYLGGYNLLTFTKYSGFDPGATNFGILARGVDRGYYPISKSFVGGLTVNF